MKKKKHLLPLKSSLGKLLPIGVSAASFALLLASPASAANLSWDSAGSGTLGGSGTWDTSTTNWWNGASDVAWATNTTAGDTAVFAGAAGSPMVTLGTNINALGLQFITTGYTIALNGNTLALGTGGIDATGLTSGTTTISGTGGVGLAGNQTWDVGSGATLAVSSGISSSTAGTKILTVQGAGDTTISGAITAGTGAFNLNKRGTGTLTLSGGAVIGAGSIVNGNANTLSAVLLGGTTKISSGTYTSAGEFVVGGVLTNGGAGVDTNFTMDGGSLAINSFLSVGRGNGVGAVSSNVVLNNNATITASNFSGGFNGGSTLNTPKGTLTLNGTSSLSIGSYVAIAESAGSNFTININDSATFSQTANSNQTTLGVADGAVGVINVNGGTATFERDFILGGGGTGSGKVVLTSGAVNMATGTERWLKLNNSNTASTGQIDVNGGNLNLNTNSDIRYSTNGGAIGTNVINLNAGAITGYVGNQTGGFSGGSLIDMNQGSTQAGVSNTFNLNGGTLTIGQIISTRDEGTAVFNFNGGTLKAAAASTAFLTLGGANQHAYVKTGGAIIDTNSVNVTISQALEAAPGGSGGLTKQGAGTLTLGGVNTYTGATTVNTGTLALGASGSILNSTGVAIKAGATFNTTLQSFAMLSTQPFTFTLDAAGGGSAGLISAAALDIANGVVSFSIVGTLDDPAYVLANYTSLAGGTFSNVTNLPSGYALDYNYLGGNSIALVAVPEPHEFALAIVALLGVLVFIRRRNQQV
jgi:autotransporter-associated beta strand protein